MSELFIRRHLQQMVYEALTHENVKVSKLVGEYTVNILVDFIDAEHLTSSEGGLPVLAWLYRDAANLKGSRKIAALKKLGDVSLFLAGLFSDYVRKTTNGLGYYVDMGRSAYDTIAVSALNPIYDELSKNFIPLVGALNFIASRTSTSHELDLDGLFELYVRDSKNLELQRRIMRKSSIPIISAMGSD